LDPTFGANPTSYFSDLDIIELSSGDEPAERPPLLRRVRVRREAHEETIPTEFSDGVAVVLSDLGQQGEIPDETHTELESLREQLAERDRQLAEWQTCHETVEREFKRASDRAAALQSKINATSNELAQARSELAKARSEAEANRKANEALNRQLQGILKANQSKPPAVAVPAKPAAKRKPSHKAPGELAA